MNTALKILQLKAKRKAYTLLSGQNLSTLLGEGYDFSELSEYQIGDDIRKINWTITAKLGKPYIKEFHTNRELNVVVAGLMESSLYFGAGNAKQIKLTEVASLLAYATYQHNDLFTGFCYTQHQTYTTTPTKQLPTIETFSQTLYEIPLLHTALNTKVSLQSLFRQLHKPSLLFILSDFLEKIDLSLLAQKHEVIAVIIRDKEEEYPQSLGEVTLYNPQNKNTFQTYFSKKNKRQYLEKLHQNDKILISHFSKYNIRYIKILTNDNIVEKLLTLF